MFRMTGSDDKTPKRRGRPADVGATVTLTMRVTPSTKAALEAAARAGGRSVSRQAERMLSDALRDPAGLESRAFGPAHTKALAVAVARLAIEVEEQTGADWREDRFAHQTLALVVAQLFRHLAPRGALKVPAAVREIAARSLAPDAWQKPAGLASAIASRFIIRLKTMPEISAEELAFRDRVGADRGRGVTPDDAVILPRVRRDLGVEQVRPASHRMAATPASERTPEDVQRQRDETAAVRAAVKARRDRNGEP